MPEENSQQIRSNTDKNKTENNGGKDMRWLILITVIVGTFLGRLDQTVVNLALPKIMSDFSITVANAGWIVTAYILANAIFVPIWGKLGDTLGRKKVYILGFSIFIIGSVLAGFAWNLTSMIVFRVIQAIASSADYPTAMAIIAVTFKDNKERAHALGLWSSSFAASAVLGPLIGGPLIDIFGWRSVFFVNLPIGIVGLLMALAFIKESVAGKKNAIFDWWGSITLGLSLTALVLVLDKGVDWGWLSLNSILCYLVMLVTGYLFLGIERKNREPIVNLKFFKNTVFVVTLINTFVIFMGMMGSIFLLPIFVQTFLGYDATQTGYLFMPMAFFMMIAAPIGASLTGKIQTRYVITFSTLIAAVGIFMFQFLDPRATIFDILLPLSIMALGMGLGMAHRTNLIASAVPENEVGVASSILALVRNIAGAFGVALFTTILDNNINNNVINLSRFSSLHGQSALDYQRYIGLIILKAQVSGYGHVYFISSIIVFVGAFTALFIKLEHEKKAKAEIMME